MSEPFLVGLIGARGHTGRELIRLISGHPEMMLAYASSREFAGRKVSEIAPEAVGEDCLFEALEPEAAARRRADAVILALPDGTSAPFMAAFEAIAPQRVQLDLSADKRFDDRWVYGLPERNRAAIAGARRIANPGCYATAAQLAVGPLVDRLGGAPVIFGVSGYSGAGSTPNPRNNKERLADNLMPYALTGHKHEREVSRHLGTAVRFSPHVHPAFRGLLVTCHIPLNEPMQPSDLMDLYNNQYKDEPLIRLRNEPPELKDGAERMGALLGGFSVSEDGKNAVVVAAEDNLLKGAAVQAIQNLNLTFGINELTGITLGSADDG
ncbi:MAG: N-acetyl-gamma-glutamyl-phosphate reductase [Pseudomonadota bacterium]